MDENLKHSGQFETMWRPAKATYLDLVLILTCHDIWMHQNENKQC